MPEDKPGITRRTIHLNGRIYQIKSKTYGTSRSNEPLSAIQIVRDMGAYDPGHPEDPAFRQIHRKVMQTRNLTTALTTKLLDRITVPEKILEDTFRCAAEMRHGSFESDSISIKVQGRGYMSVWLNKPALEDLTEEEKEIWAAMMRKFWDADEAAKAQRWACTQELNRIAKERGVQHKSDLPEWADHIRRLQAAFPSGIGAFWVDLTSEEIRLIEKFSDQRLARHERLKK